MPMPAAAPVRSRAAAPPAVSASIASTNAILQQNLDSVISRGESLDELAAKSESL